MSIINSVGVPSWYPKPQFASPAAKAVQNEETGPTISVSELEKPNRPFTPEDEEKLKKTLAGQAAADLSKVLKEDAQRAADKREAEGRDPTGAVLDIRA